MVTWLGHGTEVVFYLIAITTSPPPNEPIPKRLLADSCELEGRYVKHWALSLHVDFRRKSNVPFFFLKV